MASLVTQMMTMFNPKLESHVLWLKSLGETMKSMKGMENVLSQNPFKMKIKPTQFLDVPEIHFVLAVKYTDALFQGEAWIPPQKK